MKTLLFSKDKELIDYFVYNPLFRDDLIVFQTIENPLDAFTFTINEKPYVLILDDDMLKPNTVSFVKNIKKLINTNNIIVITSNESMEFGKELYTLGLLHYSIKPCNYLILNDFISSLFNKNKLKIK